MARGNYALLAFDLTGETTGGSLISHAGIRAAIYKNWVYLYDEDAYRDDLPYTKSPLIGRLDNGTLQYGDMKVYAERGPQQGVYAVFKTGSRRPDAPPRQAVAALGVSGYGSDDFFGIREEAAAHLPEVVNNATGCKWSNFVADDNDYYQSTGEPNYDPDIFTGHCVRQAPRDWE